jgi:two-component sensor histidine kinase
MIYRKGSIRNRFVLVILLAVVPLIIAVTASAFVTSSLSKSRLELQIENSTTTLHMLIDSLLRNSVRAYLRSKVEAGYNLVSQAMAKGVPAEEIPHLLDPLRVGGDGYFYIIDTKGLVIHHPDKTIQGQRIPNETPVKEQIEQKEGYFEYLWQNSDEAVPRKKALFMVSIPKLSWILAATSYRDQFVTMVDLQALQEAIASVQFGDGGYSYVIARDGSFIAHPYLSVGGESRAKRLVSEKEFDAIIEELYSSNSGMTSYLWRDEPDEKLRRKMVNFKYLEDFDWVVGTAIYETDIGISVRWLVFINSLSALIIALLLSLLIRHINRRIENTILDISKVLGDYSKGDTSARVKEYGPAELGMLSHNLNAFLAEVEISRLELAAGLEEREELLREIQHRVKNNLQVILSLLHLQQAESRFPETVEALERSRNRINSMALVYEYLSERRERMKEDVLPFHWFLERYTTAILSSGSFHKIEGTLHLEELYLDRNRAIYCGLLVNELLSLVAHRCQSLEHHASIERFQVHIHLKETQEGVVLTIAGGDGTFSPENKKSQELITILAQQIQGREVSIAPFSEYTITFSKHLET